MKKTLLLFSAAALILTSCVSNPDGKKAATTDSVATTTEASGTELAVDTTQSTISWLGKKVSGQHNGTVKIKSGKLLLSAGKLTGGNFVIDLTSINDQDLEGEYKQKLEGHLKSADFFDVEKYPEGTFEVTAVAAGATDSLINISGNLTLRGVSKNITFEATTSAVSDTSVIADADFNIAREDWGIVYEGKADDLISKEINLKVHLVAGK